METIRVSMTELHHNLAQYIELARAGNVVEVVNKLRGRVECLLVAPAFLPASETNAPNEGVPPGGQAIIRQSNLERDLLGADTPYLDIAALWSVAAELCTPSRPQARRLLDALRLRYTTEGKHQRTYAQMGTELDISTKQARQLAAKALQMLRHPTCLKRIAEIAEATSTLSTATRVEVE